jgi:hypothetical protein
LIRNNAILADIHARKGARNLSEPTDVLPAAVVSSRGATSKTFVNADLTRRVDAARARESAAAAVALGAIIFFFNADNRRCANIVKTRESIATVDAARGTLVTIWNAGIASTACAREAT